MVWVLEITEQVMHISDKGKIFEYYALGFLFFSHYFL